MGVGWRLLVECGVKFSIYSKGEWENINQFKPAGSIINLNYETIPLVRKDKADEEEERKWSFRRLLKWFR